jgi:hypothetical protein
MIVMQTCPHLLNVCFPDMQSQFINQHVTASIIQRNAPTNAWSWEFNIVQRACPRVLFGGLLSRRGSFVLNQETRLEKCDLITCFFGNLLRTLQSATFPFVLNLQ